MRTLRLIILAWGLLAASVAAEPAIELSLSEFDFGHVARQTTLYSTVWFRSTGTDTLRIYEIKTGCDCAVMPFENRKIAPGDSVAATLVWETERVQGLIRRFPRVFTNASPDPERLTYKAMVLMHPDSARPVQILPYRFVFTDFAGRTRDSIEFTLTNLGSDNYAVLLPPQPPGPYEIVLPDSLEAGSSVKGHIKLTAEGVADEYDGTLTLQFNARGKDPHRFSVPIRREIYAP